MKLFEMIIILFLKNSGFCYSDQYFMFFFAENIKSKLFNMIQPKFCHHFKIKVPGLLMKKSDFNLKSDFMIRVTCEFSVETIPFKYLPLP